MDRCHLITTDAVLTEFLNALADKGRHIRSAAVQMAEMIMRNPEVTVIPMSRRTFARNLSCCTRPVPTRVTASPTAARCF
jgi:hypothetical protein